MLDGVFQKIRAWVCSNLVKKRSERPVVVPDCALGAFIGCHDQKRFKKNNSDCRWGLISRLPVTST
jgi:hypothetical protein